MRILFLGILCLFYSDLTFAQDSNGILGTWFNQEKDSKIQIYKSGESYFGKIVWIKNHPADENPALDSKNPDEEDRKKPVMGLNILKNFRFSGKNSWIEGKIYNPRDGNSYAGKMTLKNKNTLDLRGYIGSPIFGKTVTFTRVTD